MDHQYAAEPPRRVTVSWRVTAALALVAWGAFSFGGVYPWAFVPLFAGAALAGGAALAERSGAGRVNATLALALALVAAAILVQLIPLPLGTLQAISPETHEFLGRYRVGYPSLFDGHPLSIAPRRTMVALAAMGALSLFLLGFARALTRDDAVQIVRVVAILGVALAVAGIVQQALWNGKIYGFWTPRHPGLSFGPFVNRNHFAGWMLMAMPLAMAYFAARVARGMRTVEPGWRHRLLWLASAEATETVFAGFAVLVMGLALTLSMSRSGMLGLLAAVTVSGSFIARRRVSASRRLVIGGFLVMLLAVTLGWTGADRVMDRFAEGDMTTFGNRAGVWRDTLDIAGRFPVAGTGLNTFGVATILYQTTEPHKHYGEAHSDYLQLLAEGGVLVVAPAVLVLLVIAAAVVRGFRNLPADSTDYWIRLGAVTGLVAIGVQEAVDFSLQMPGNALLFVLLLAIALRPAAPRRSPR